MAVLELLCAYWFIQCYASLVTQMVKNPPAIQETWVGKIPRGRYHNPLQKSIMENPHGQWSWRAIWGHKVSDTTESFYL